MTTTNCTSQVSFQKLRILIAVEETCVDSCSATARPGGPGRYLVFNDLPLLGQHVSCLCYCRWTCLSRNNPFCFVIYSLCRMCWSIIVVFAMNGLFFSHLSSIAVGPRAMVESTKYISYLSAIVTQFHVISGICMLERHEHVHGYTIQ